MHAESLKERVGLEDHVFSCSLPERVCISGGICFNEKLDSLSIFMGGGGGGETVENVSSKKLANPEI